MELTLLPTYLPLIDPSAVVPEVIAPRLNRVISVRITWDLTESHHTSDAAQRLATDSVAAMLRERVTFVGAENI
jgi:hypothetical protein